MSVQRSSPEHSTSLPSKYALATTQSLASAHRHLSCQISGSPTARSSWAFYEELDAWLGPFGPTGYPIGYGRFYAKAFTTHRRLIRNSTTRAWVLETAAILQETLLDFVLRRMAAGTLATLEEPELRRAAFATHARAYDRAGLARVIVLAPELVPVIGAVSIAEFDPRSENFVPTLDQALRVTQRVLPKAGIMAAWTAWQMPRATFRALARATHTGKPAAAVAAAEPRP
jgi:hypothetical protein